MVELGRFDWAAPTPRKIGNYLSITMYVKLCVYDIMIHILVNAKLYHNIFATLAVLQSAYQLSSLVGNL
jgi:hypothetical protein